MKRIKKLIILLCGIVCLTGCTKSTIVKPEGPVMDKPDEAIHFNLKLDLDQLYEDVQMAALDKSDYPLAVSVDFNAPEEGETMHLTVVVKDDASPEECCEYADAVIKIINDAVVQQDYSFALSRECYFGGYFQERPVEFKLYHESEYPDGTPSIECEIPKDTYVQFEAE